LRDLAEFPINFFFKFKLRKIDHIVSFQKHMLMKKASRARTVQVGERVSKLDDPGGWGVLPRCTPNPIKNVSFANSFHLLPPNVSMYRREDVRSQRRPSPRGISGDQLRDDRVAEQRKQGRIG
jgi:hypothetical protein